MTWNEYAKVGARLQDAFLNHEYQEDCCLEDASFVFDILDKVRMEEGYTLKILLATDRGLGSVSQLVALPDNYDGDELTLEFDPRTAAVMHIIVEPTEMGTFQAMLLMFAPSWMPVFWHGGYDRRIFMFNKNNLNMIQSDYYGTPTNFNAEDFADDERLNPTVEIDNNHVTVTCCYWNAWTGLIRTKFFSVLDENNHLLPCDEDYDEDEDGAEMEDFEELRHEVLFEYNCGICF